MNKPVVAFDLETYLIDGPTPPKPVCLSYWNHPTLHGGVVDNCKHNTASQTNLELTAFQLLYDCYHKEQYELVGHNVKFDLSVLYYYYERLRPLIIGCLDKGLIHDTLIREKLFDISSYGRLRVGNKHVKKPYSLGALVKRYLHQDIMHLKEGEDIWRLRYNELDGVPVSQYPKEAYDYALSDTKETYEVYMEQELIRQPFGFGSMNTESLQVKSDFALDLIYQQGLLVDKPYLEEFEKTLDSKLDPLKEKLITLGYASISKKGKFNRKKKDFIKYIEEEYADYVKKTKPTKTHPLGQTSITEDDLEEYPADEIILTWKNINLWEKYKNTYIKNIKKHPKFHCQYDILKETGRTSSFIQTMPREGGVREIFVSPEGYKIVTIDFSAMELCAVANTDIEIYGKSKLAEFINSGTEPKDIHSFVACEFLSKTKGVFMDYESFVTNRKAGCVDEVYYRNMCKPIGLSIRGAAGNKRLAFIHNAQSEERIEAEQVKEIRRVIFEAFPEIGNFLTNHKNSGMSWMDHNKTGPDQYYYETNGRFRSNCTYCSCANGKSMQSPSADGAKEAIWEVIKYSILFYEVIPAAFIHDEIVFYIKNNDRLYKHIQNLSHLMCEGMQKVLNNVRITCEYSIMSRWSKKVHEAEGKLWLNPLGRYVIL